jgi:hypothetical protein
MDDATINMERVTTASIIAHAGFIIGQMRAAYPQHNEALTALLDDIGELGDRALAATENRSVSND